MKDNKLLAEYLNQLYYPFEWHPDKDWNQLMMVVEKIEKECERPEDFLFSMWRDAFGSGVYRGVIFRGNISDGATFIEAVYNACVEYIKSK